MGDSVINITAKFNGTSIPITVSPDSTIQRVKAVLLPFTSVLPRGQKLIFKGRLLENEMILRDAGVMNGAKLMLLGPPGLHRGDGPILNEASVRTISRNTNVNETKEVQLGKNCMERWKATGIIGLAEHNLKAIPDEVWACSPFIRVLDISNNSIQRVPSQIDSLTALKMNPLTGGTSIAGPSNRSISKSKLVDLSANHLTELPARFCSLINLKALYLSNNNALRNLPLFLLDACPQLSTLDVHNTEITMDVLRQYEGWEDFDKPRGAKQQKQIDSRVMNSAEFDEGADKS